MNEKGDLQSARMVMPRKPTVAHGPPRAGREPDRHGMVLTTRVGLQMPPGLNFDDWQQAGRRLAGILDSSSWWLGDWLVYGKDNYADRYQRGIRTAGLKYQTLRNYAWVSRRFDMSRRRARLSFQHHAEVASLPVDEQEYWLERAEKMQWTTKQLRTCIQDSRDGAPAVAAEQPPASMSRLPVPGSRLQWWHKAAAHTGMVFDKWVLMTLDSAAEQILQEQREREGLLEPGGEPSPTDVVAALEA